MSQDDDDNKYLKPKMSIISFACDDDIIVTSGCLRDGVPPWCPTNKCPQECMSLLDSEIY